MSTAFGELHFVIYNPVKQTKKMTQLQLGYLILHSINRTLSRVLNTLLNVIFNCTIEEFHIYNLTALLNLINMRNYYVLTVPKLDGRRFHDQHDYS